MNIEVEAGKREGSRKSRLVGIRGGYDGGLTPTKKSCSSPVRSPKNQPLQLQFLHKNIKTVNPLSVRALSLFGAES